MWWWIGGVVVYLAVGLGTCVAFAEGDAKGRISKPSDERVMGCAFFGLVWPLSWVIFAFMFAALSCYMNEVAKQNAPANESA